jgi:glycosyltransferase involved in cell wall biosynthesis
MKRFYGGVALVFDRQIKVAIVHDFLYVYGGAERVLKAILSTFPYADVFSLFDVLSDENRSKIGLTKSASTTFLQRMPMIKTRHRIYMPLMPIAIEQLDLSGYDLIISSSYAVAKGVITGPDQLHISYIHSPMRYAWDLQHQYLKESNKNKGLKGLIARSLLHQMRMWDVRTAHGPNLLLANSQFVARRIHKIYGRDADVMYPPVDVPQTLIADKQYNYNVQPYFLTASRLVPYKNIHLIAEAFAQLPQHRLIIAGDGPDLARIKGVSGANVEFAGYISDDELKTKMRHASAFVFAAEEDFGIVPIEAQAQGTPVIALGKGGLRETIITTGERRTGMFFNTSSPLDIAETIKNFVTQQSKFKASDCHANALRFSEIRFKQDFSEYVTTEYERFKMRLDDTRAKPLPTISVEQH